MKKHVREFLEQEEATAAARSKEVKKKQRDKRKHWFSDYLTEKAERIEAAGNPAAAAQFRAFWSRLSRRGKA